MTNSTFFWQTVGLSLQFTNLGGFDRYRTISSDIKSSFHERYGRLVWSLKYFMSSLLTLSHDIFSKSKSTEMKTSNVNTRIYNVTSKSEELMTFRPVNILLFRPITNCNRRLFFAIHLTVVHRSTYQKSKKM